MVLSRCAQVFGSIGSVSVKCSVSARIFISAGKKINWRVGRADPESKVSSPKNFVPSKGIFRRDEGDATNDKIANRRVKHKERSKQSKTEAIKQSHLKQAREQVKATKTTNQKQAKANKSTQSKQH